MSGAFKGQVYWKEQCKFCVNSMYCKYRDAVELLQAKLKVVELETDGCYGTLCFWCDYYREDAELVDSIQNTEQICEVINNAD